jgi:galactokinase
MDQMIVATAKIGHAMLFDCRAFLRKPIPIPPEDLRVVIANTMVKHDLTGADGKSEYAKRREQCEAGVAYFKTVNPAIKSLRDVTPEMVNQAQGKLDDVVLRRCRHVVGETQRCQDAAAALVAKDYAKVGELMKQSHASLRDDYQVSCVELDFLSDEASKVQGVYGARMTGGGFGGCIVALCQPTVVDALIAHLKATYKNSKYGIDPVVFATSATSGAGVME